MNYEDNVLVSICCVAYNHEKYIGDALEGFIKQKTNFKFEVIINDDASTDATPKIIREYAEKYPQIIKPILQTENQYSKGVRIIDEILIPKSKGRYIAICDGDDYWCDYDKLQKQIDFLEKNKEYSACVHNSRKVDCVTGEEKLFNIENENIGLECEEIIQSWGSIYQTSALVFRREYSMKDAPGFFKTKGFGDYSRAIYLRLNGKVYYFADIMSVYRENSSQYSWTVQMNVRDDIWEKKQIEHCKIVSEMLRGLDSFTKQKYHNVIEKTIRKREYDLCHTIKEYKKIIREYKDMLIQESIRYRIIIYILAYCPKIYEIYMKYISNILK